MQEPFPHQGAVSTQQQQPPPGDSGNNNHEIYMTSEEIFFQTQNRSSPVDTILSGASTSAPTTLLTISKIPIKPLPKMDKGPTRRGVHHSKPAHNYSIFDDLAQYPTVMSALEVLHSCPNQRKALLYALGTIDPIDSSLIDFDLDKATPMLPSLVAF